MSGVEQRRYERYALRLSASFGFPGAPPSGCEIRDFCRGGMFIAYADGADASGLAIAPSAGDVIEIRCAVPAGTRGRDVRLDARVVRTARHGAGVAFVDPDPSALLVLETYAKEGTAEPLPPGPEVSLPAGHVLQVGRQLVIEHLPSIMARFVHDVREYLLTQAKQADEDQREAYLKAARTLEDRDAVLEKAFVASVATQLDDAFAHERRPAPAEPDAPLDIGSLSLVEDDELEDWLAVAEIDFTLSEVLKAPLFEIEQRLSQLYGRPVERNENPFRPGIFAQAFQESLESLDLDHVAAQAAFRVLKRVLEHELANVYKALNQRLVDEGAFPGVHHAIVKDDRHVRRRPGDAAGHGNAPSVGVTETLTAGASAQAAAEHPIPPEATEQELYRLVQELRALKEQVGRGVDQTGYSIEPLAAGGEQVPPRPVEEHFNLKEVLAALSAIDLGAPPAPAAESESQAIRVRLTAALSELGEGGADKRLGGREADLIEVAGEIFNSLLQDKLLAGSVKTWIQRLEVPLLKLALVDDALFFDRQHVARQVINRISQLELYGDDEKGGRSTVKQMVDRLVDMIKQDFDGSTAVFERALKQLDAIVNIQNKAYRENVKEVIRACEEEQRRCSEESAATEPEPEEPADAETRQWLRRVRRLPIGGWLLFPAADGRGTHRLRLAWASESKDRFVFVNLQGLKEASFGAGELAAQLREGRVIPLDNADEPAVDRAQYVTLQELHHQLLHESTHDQLTGLFNRREFEKRLASALADAKEKDHQHVLCYLDLDQLKVINNTCGYEAGDRLLHEVADLLRGEMGEAGTLARIGSDEFGMLLENCTVRSALGIAQLQQDALENYRFEWQDERRAVSVSMGLVGIDAESADLTTLMRAAESSCGRAKDKGRGRIQVYQTGDLGASERAQAMHWVARIDRALEENRLALKCQRIVPIQDPKSTRPHFEVLLGIKDEQGRDISPAEFVQAAEIYNRIGAVDRWVIARVFRWMAQHPEQLKALGGLAINLSGRSLNDEHLVDFIIEQRRKTDVPMNRVCFEVTETAGIANLSDAAEFIQTVKKMGCLFSLDDFGSGMSSYAYLKNLPVDYLKIDGAFVEDMLNNPTDLAVVKSISEIGHFLGKEIIAERVQDEATIEVLREMGVDYVQGFGVEMPRGIEDLASRF